MACQSVLGVPQRPPSAADRTLHCQWRCRGQRNQCYVICTTLSGIRRFQSCDFKHGLFTYLLRICRCGICDSDPRKGASAGQRRVSSLDWPLNPTSTATATLLHRNAAMSLHGHCVTVADSNRADLNCDGSLEGDPLIVARTVPKLSNSVAAARPPFCKPATCKF